MRKLNLIRLIIKAILAYARKAYFWRAFYDSGKCYTDHNKVPMLRNNIISKYNDKILEYVDEFVWGK